jgi:hypothetical protein
MFIYFSIGHSVPAVHPLDSRSHRSLLSAKQAFDRRQHRAIPFTILFMVLLASAFAPSDATGCPLQTASAVGGGELQTLEFDYQPVPGQAHFDFALPDVNTGEIRRLSDFKGKKVILIHFASW